MKISENERIRNRAMRSILTKSIKGLKDCENKAEAADRLKDVISKIDKAAQNNLIHKNKAQRDKSKMTQFVNKLSE